MQKDFSIYRAFKHAEAQKEMAMWRMVRATSADSGRHWQRLQREYERMARKFERTRRAWVEHQVVVEAARLAALPKEPRRDMSFNELMFTQRCAWGAAIYRPSPIVHISV